MLRAHVPCSHVPTLSGHVSLPAWASTAPVQIPYTAAVWILSYPLHSVSHGTSRRQMLQWQQNSLVFMNGILNEEAVNMYKDGTQLKTNKTPFSTCRYDSLTWADLPQSLQMTWSYDLSHMIMREWWIYQIREGFSVSNFSTTRDRRPQFPLTKLTPYGPRIHEVSWASLK